MEYNVVYERFDNINQMLTAINGRPANEVWKGHSLSSETGSEGFTRTKSYKEAMQFIESGWSEPLEKIKRGVENGFKSNGTRNKAVPRTGVVGYAPCVPNAILGLPNSMIMTEKTTSKVKAVTILYGMSVTANINQEDIYKAGIVLLNIINDLELAGYRVKLDVEYFSSREGNDVYGSCVTVKDWRQPLDLKKLAFPISHPSMFRRLGFRWLETNPNVKNRSIRSGYGRNVAEGYENMTKFYKDYGLLKQNEYYIDVYFCRNKKFDKDEIVKACGLIDIKNKGAA